MNEVWTVKRLLDWSGDYFKKRGIEPAKLTTQLLLSHILGLPKLQLFLQFDRELSATELSSYKELLLRRVNHEPLEYIVGYTEFIGLPIMVAPGVLIPRPETEELVIKAEQYIKRMSGIQAIVDIGTGSGVIAIYLKKKFPDVNVYATDISFDALQIAEQNAKKNQVNIVLINDFFPKEEAFNNNLSLVIVTNPPYIRTSTIARLQPEVKDFEPMFALDGGEDGLKIIKEILVKALNLKCNVTIFMEIGFDQAEDVKYLCDSLSISDVVFFEDVNRIQRIAKIDIQNN